MAAPYIVRLARLNSVFQISLSYTLPVRYGRFGCGSMIHPVVGQLPTSGASLVVQLVKNLPAVQEPWVRSLG